MKTLNKIGFLFLMTAAVGFLFSSCGSTDGDSTAPKLTLSPDFTFEDRDATPDENIRIDIVVTSEEKIADISMVVANGANEDEVYLLEDVNEKSYSGSISRNANATVNAVETWTITVTDKKGGSTSKSIVITTKGESPDLSLAEDKMFFNVIGKEHGAYDLVAQATVAASGAAGTKDLVDQTTSDFSKQWGTSNGTEFIKTAAGGTFAAYVKLSDIETTWESQKANITSTVDVAVGDLILVKSGQVGNPMFVVVVTAVTDGAGNDDSYTFDYKGVF